MITTLYLQLCTFIALCLTVYTSHQHFHKDGGINISLLSLLPHSMTLISLISSPSSLLFPLHFLCSLCVDSQLEVNCWFDLQASNLLSFSKTLHSMFCSSVMLKGPQRRTPHTHTFSCFSTLLAVNKNEFCVLSFPQRR